MTLEQLAAARYAWRRFGKGNHAAGLNFGDCFAYALADVTREPLLFKGDDFARTDVRNWPDLGRERPLDAHRPLEAAAQPFDPPPVHPEVIDADSRSGTHLDHPRRRQSRSSRSSTKPIRVRQRACR